VSAITPTWKKRAGGFGIGTGCTGIPEFYGARDDKKSIAAVQRALELEIYFLENADIYGIGDNEELVGKAIRGARDKVFSRRITVEPPSDATLFAHRDCLRWLGTAAIC
jgi:diketogulonate reductase-like aldo/keto reductase